MNGHEIWDTSELSSAGAAAITRALSRCTFDFNRLDAGIQSVYGKSKIGINIRDLSSFAAEHEIVFGLDAMEGEHNHDHNYDVLTSEAGVLGLFWWGGPSAPLVEIEQSLMGNPDLFDGVFHAEGAHATDFCYMDPTGQPSVRPNSLRAMVYALMCGHQPKHPWLEGTYSAQVGEGFMGVFIRAFTNINNPVQGFVHTPSNDMVVMIRDILQSVAPPPPPPPPPEPYPVVEIDSELHIWDGRSAVSNPLGRGPMGTLEGQATHHTVTAIIQNLHLLSKERDLLADRALELGNMLAFDATIEQELAHVKAIDTYHKSLGWGGFAYHGIAYLSGRAYLCGNLDGQRAHVKDHNHELHGLAFNGDFSSGLPAQSALVAGGHFLQYVRRETGTSLPIKGHREWGTATACPGALAGFDWAPYLEEPSPPPQQPYLVERRWVELNVLSDGSSYPVEWIAKATPPSH